MKVFNKLFLREAFMSFSHVAINTHKLCVHKYIPMLQPDIHQYI